MAFNMNNFLPSQESIYKDGYSEFGKKLANPQATVAFIVQLALSVAAVGFLIVVVISGIRYIFSSGNEEGTKAALHSLVSAVIGLAITLTAYGVTTWILHAVGILSS